jgi:TrmH family RNA methyltransferase
MALDAGLSPVQVFYCSSQLTADDGAVLLDRFRQIGVELIEVSPAVMGALSERDSPLGIVGTFALFEASLRDLSLRGRDLIVVLDRLQDPGNLGTLIRTADAVGATAIILIEPCVDPFDPKTVRGTMGSLFNLPLLRTSDVTDLFSWLKNKGLRLVGTDSRRGAVWGEGVMAGGVVLVLGNETRGLSNDVCSFVEAWARLPIVGKAESLNVAVAGGVLMYTWLRANLGDQSRSQDHATCAQKHIGQDN